MKTYVTYLFKALIIVLVGVIFMNLTICFAQSPWTQKADMLYRAFDHSSCIFEGKLYVMGGLDGYHPTNRNYALDSVSVYDPEQDSWSLRANMPNNRCSFSSCVYNGKILAMGGSKSIYYTPVTAIDIYDPVSDTWSHLTDIPLAGNWQPAALLDDKIYVFSGAPNTDSDFPYDNVQIYNLLTDTWSEGAKMPTPRYDGSAIALNDKIYVIGGEQGDYLGMNTVEVYDPATDNWITETDMIIPRKWHANCLLDSSIFVFGGMYGSCSDWHSGGELYDPKADLWREITPNKDLSGPCRIAPYNGNVYVLGGKVTTCPELSIYDCKSLFLYEPHFDLYPIFTFVDKNPVIAGADTVLISAKFNDPLGISVMARLHTLDGFPLDSLQLYDDGNHGDGASEDSVFANYWKIESREEMQYYIDLKVTKIRADTVVNYFNNSFIIATDELVTCTHFDKKDGTCGAIYGDCILTTLTLQNNSSQYSATNIKAKLESLDSSVSVFNPILSYDVIPAGDHTPLASFKLIISANFSGTRDVPIVVHISSYDSIFRSDTFLIEVQEPGTYIKNVQNSQIKIFPNPTNDLLTIETSQPGQHFIEIISLNGQFLYTDRIQGPTQTIDLSPLQKGLYLLTVKSKDFLRTVKLIKQ